MAIDPDLKSRIVETALALTDEEGWNRFSVATVAARADVPLTDVYALFPTKAHVLCRIFAHHDRTVLAGGVADDDLPRDRLFDVMMRRFDALQAHRQAVTRIIREAPMDPLSAVAALPALGQSMAWMLETAGIPANGLAGILRIKGLSLVYINVLRTWLEDDSGDMAKTMAALDRDLRRADGVVQRLGPLMGNDRWTAADDSADFETSADTASNGSAP